MAVRLVCGSRALYCTACRPPPMSDIKPAPTVIDTESSNEIPIPVDDVESPTSKPEFASETLYIQNLNEKIRIDGSSLETFSVHVLTAFFSSQSIFARSFQVLRGSTRCGRAQQPSNARTSIRLI
jgi:hypothetical protein